MAGVYTNKRVVMPNFVTRTIGTNTHAIISQGDISNGYTSPYGQLEAHASYTGTTLLASVAPTLPVLWTEQTVQLLLDGVAQSGGLPTNPKLQLPARPWGTVGTLIRPPRSLLFTDFDAFALNAIKSADSDTFLTSLATQLTDYNVLACNGICADFDCMFAYHPLAQGLIFGTTTTTTTTLGTEEVGVVTPSQWIGGACYEVLLTYYYPWTDYGNTALPCTGITDNYIAQNIAAYPRYHKRKKLVYFAEFGSGTPSGAAGRAECERAMTALADYGYEYIPLSPAGVGETSLNTQRALFQTLVYDLAGDVDDFFSNA